MSIYLDSFDPIILRDLEGKPLGTVRGEVTHASVTDAELVARHEAAVDQAIREADQAREAVLQEVEKSTEAQAVALWQARLADVEKQRAALAATVGKHVRAQQAGWEEGNTAPLPAKVQDHRWLMSQLDGQAEHHKRKLAEAEARLVQVRGESLEALRQKQVGESLARRKDALGRLTLAVVQAALEVDAEDRVHTHLSTGQHTQHIDPERRPSPARLPNSLRPAVKVEPEDFKVLTDAADRLEERREKIASGELDPVADAWKAQGPPARQVPFGADPSSLAL